jgi:phthalate 4,5-dioxygenase
VRTVAYPTYEDGTLIWAYLGPADVRPSRPPAIWESTPVERRSALRMDAEGNWFQHLEGQIDSSHVAFLHNYVSRGDHLYGDEAAYSDPTPGLFLDDTEYGTMVGWLRKGRAGARNLRMTQWAVPFMTGIAGFIVDGNNQFHFAAPIDDNHTMYIVVSNNPVVSDAARPMTDEARRLMTLEFRPGTYRLVASAENDYFIDREMQKNENFSGIGSIRVQDMAVQERVRGGTLADRSREHLVASDRAIIHARQRILGLVDRLEAGETLTEPHVLASMRFQPYDRDLDASVDLVQYAREDLARLNSDEQPVPAT